MIKIPDDNIQVVKRKLNIHYQIITLDLTKERKLRDEEIHPYEVEHFNELKVLYAPSPFKIILNSKKNDVIPIRQNDTTTILNFKIKQLYITNEVLSGVAVIWLASREQ